MQRRIIIPIILAVALIGGGSWVLFQQRAAASDQHTFSGTIEADEVDITSEVNGKVEQLLVDDGDQIKTGDTLVVLNTDLLNTQLEQSRAAVQVAEANLTLLKAGSRSQDIATAQGQLDQAVAQRDGAQQAFKNAQASTVVTQAQVQLDGSQRAYNDALKLLRNPQDIQGQVLQAQAARDSAQAALTQTQTNEQATKDRLSTAKTQAESALAQAANNLRNAQDAYSRVYWDNRNLEKELGKFGKELPQENKDAEATALRAVQNGEEALEQAKVAAANARQAEITGNQTATEQVTAAQTALSNAQRTLDHSASVQANPQQLQSTADAALSQVNTARANLEAARLQRQSAIDNANAQLAGAEAQVSQAQARLELAQAGSRVEQIKAAEAQVAQARAQVRQLEVQISKAMLKAPVDGIVLERIINLGEQAVTGNILVKVGSLAKVKLTIYVPEDQIGPLQLHQGTTVHVQVDSFANRSFNGVITYIAPQAEFTPRNVQTRVERATTVFPVRIELDNTDGALKPGMPADATVQ